MKINNSSLLPCYFQIVRFIEEQIKSGQIKAGEKIPSENELAKMFGVGRPTIRHALDVLERKRMIVRKKGIGSFVANKYDETSLLYFFDLENFFPKSNFEKKLLKRLTVEVIKDEKNPFFGLSAYNFLILFSLGNTPFALLDYFFDFSNFFGLDRYRIEEVRISDLLENEFRTSPRRIIQSFKSTFPDVEITKLLKISKHIPVTIIEQHFYFEGDEKEKIFIRSYYNTSLYEPVQEIKI